jgi:hypothetical protein
VGIQKCVSVVWCRIKLLKSGKNAEHVVALACVDCVGARNVAVWMGPHLVRKPNVYVSNVGRWVVGRGGVG